MFFLNRNHPLKMIYSWTERKQQKFLSLQIYLQASSKCNKWTYSAHLKNTIPLNFKGINQSKAKCTFRLELECWKISNNGNKIHYLIWCNTHREYRGHKILKRMSKLCNTNSKNTIYPFFLFRVEVSVDLHSWEYSMQKKNLHIRILIMPMVVQYSNLKQWKSS